MSISKLIQFSRFVFIVDKMLFLFWLPVLAIAFVYTIVTSLPFTIGKALLGPILGPLTRFLHI